MGRATNKKAARAKQISRNYSYAKRSQHNLPIRVAKHKHTGKLLSVHHTSYALLFFLIAFLGMCLLLLNNKFIQAASDISVSGVVLGDPPSTPATINSPSNGSKFSSSIVTIKGACENGLIVEVYRNSSFAGSTICSTENMFSIDITLVQGLNEVFTKIKDLSDQYGPDSSAVIIYYYPDNDDSGSASDNNATNQPSSSDSNTPTTTGSTLDEDDLTLFTESVFKNATQGKDFKFWYQINGGKAPYAVSIEWGDNSENSVFSHNKADKFEAIHKYQDHGPFIIEVIGTDINNNRAYISSVVYVDKRQESGGVEIGPKTCDSTGVGQQDLWCGLANSIDTVWPAFVFAGGLTFSFWLGEKFVLLKVKKDLKLAK